MVPCSLKENYVQLIVSQVMNENKMSLEENAQEHRTVQRTENVAFWKQLSDISICSEQSLYDPYKMIKTSIKSLLRKLSSTVFFWC